ncbi:MAG: dodecin [bacterium]
MDQHVYKLIELAGTSQTSMEDAIQNAVSRASKTMRHLRWLEVIETRGQIEGGKVFQWQVKLRVGFTLEE